MRYRSGWYCGDQAPLQVRVGSWSAPPQGQGGRCAGALCRSWWEAPRTPWWVRLPLTHLFSCTSWMFSIPMALLRREPKGPDFFLVGLFPGTIRDCGERLRLSAYCLAAGGHASHPGPATAP